jgi:hypothetical protein
MLICIEDYLRRRRYRPAHVPQQRLAAAGGGIYFEPAATVCTPRFPPPKQAAPLALAPVAIDLPGALELCAVYAEASLI